MSCLLKELHSPFDEGELTFNVSEFGKTLTLGGLLTSMAEAELVCGQTKKPRFRLLIPPSLVNTIGTRLLNEVADATLMGSWAVQSERRPYVPTCVFAGPPKVRAHDTSRLDWLYLQSETVPTLTWSPKLLEQVKRSLGFEPQSALFVHLRNDCGPRSGSIANGEMWSEALKRICEESETRIVLVGDEQRPPGLDTSVITSSMEWRGKPVSLQLCGIATAGIFLGMASGMASAAYLSNTPAVIFKSPEHDFVEMNQAFGAANPASFWRPKQLLFRETLSAQAIYAGWRAVAVRNVR